MMSYVLIPVPAMAFNHNETVMINECATNIVCHKFQNHPYLLVTQYQKIPNFYCVKNQTVLNGIAGSKVVSIQQKFGKQSDEIEAAIRYLMRLFPKHDEIVFTLGLKTVDKSTLAQLEEHLRAVTVLQ
jgi:Proteasome assembly chaperone 3